MTILSACAILFVVLCKYLVTKAEFLEKLQDIFETDAELTEDMVLNDIEEWSSLSMMAVMAFF